jgi:flagellar biosynthesis chaperone FliJ
MPVSSALRRLLRVRDVEEEQQRLALESALSELHALEHALSAAHARQHGGRRLLALSVCEGGVADRTAALVEGQAAARCAAALTPRIDVAENNVLRARQAYLDKRTERRQAQTLIEEAEARDAAEAGRHNQQTLDETYGARRHRRKRAAGKRPGPSGSAPAPDPSSAFAARRAVFTDLESKNAAESTAIPQSGTKSDS